MNELTKELQQMIRDAQVKGTRDKMSMLKANSKLAKTKREDEQANKPKKYSINGIMHYKMAGGTYLNCKLVDGLKDK